MAKGSMMLSKMRGKMGGMVFRVDPEAGQVVSEYNGSPRNPKTVAQTNQRSKMNLAGQISSLTPFGAIAGLSRYKRQARSLFVSNILKNAGVTRAAEGDYPSRANIQFENMVFSTGRTVEGATTLGAVYDTGVVTVTFKPSNEEAGVLGVRAIVYAYKDGKFVACVAKDSMTPDASGMYTVTAVPLGANVEGGVYVAIVPIVETDGSVSIAYQNGVNRPQGVQDDPMSADVSVTIAALGGFGRSIIVGSAVITEE